MEVRQVAQAREQHPHLSPRAFAMGANLRNHAGSVSEGGNLGNLNLLLTNPATAGRIIRFVDDERLGGRSASTQVADFAQHHPLNLLSHSGTSLTSIEHVTWKSVKAAEYIRDQIDAFSNMGNGTTFVVDMSFNICQGHNVISLSSFHEELQRDIPLLVMMVPEDKRDRNVYLQFWLELFRLVPQLVARDRQNGEFILTIPGFTVDFDTAQMLGFKLACGIRMMELNNELVASDEIFTQSFQDRLREYLRDHDMEQRIEGWLRGCLYHFRSAATHASRRLPQDQQQQFLNNLNELLRVELSLAEFHEIMHRLEVNYPRMQSWLNFWTESDAARIIFPCFRTFNREQYLSMATTTSRLERWNREYHRITVNRVHTMSAVLHWLTTISYNFDLQLNSLRSGISSVPSPSRAPTVRAIPSTLLSYGILPRSTNSVQFPHPISSVRHILEAHDHFRRFEAVLRYIHSTAFPNREDMSGQLRVRVLKSLYNRPPFSLIVCSNSLLFLDISDHGCACSSTRSCYDRKRR